MNQENWRGNPEDAGGAPVQKGKRRKIPWATVSLVIAGLSIWAVTTQAKHFSLRAYLDYVGQADFRWLSAAICAMVGFVVFEACALRCACKALGYRRPMLHSIGYSAADIYFSAITPSASGGQPACAFLMMRDGIPGPVATAALMLTLSMYALALLALTVVSVALRPAIFGIFGIPSRILIAVGILIQVGLALFFVLLIRSEALLEGLCRNVIHLLAKLHLVRHEAQRQEKLRATMSEYGRCLTLLSGHRGLLWQSFLFNLLQRASQIAISMLVFLAMGCPARQAIDIFAMQALVAVGSNCVPIPGAMGVADYLMLDGFQAFLKSDRVIGMELLSRSISFYLCVLLCGLTVLAVGLKLRKAVTR